MALMPVDDAIARILSGVKPLASETIPLAQALGRTLSRTITAKRDQPPFAASAMDGYAVRHEDVASFPASLRIIGESGAGHAFNSMVRTGTAVRILTGAPVPNGADTVVIQENTTRQGTSLTVLNPTSKGKNIRRAGLDFAKADMLVAKGTKLGPRDIGLLAAGNAATIAVHRQPHIVLFTTGDELVLPGQRPRPDQIFTSNSHALEAMARSFGCRVTNLGIVRDTLAATMAAIRKGLHADILLTTGGASVGDHDFVQQGFKACGVKLGFWKVALRPGKPFMYGRKGKTHVMGLPGNPVSALVTARLFFLPLVKLLQGQSPAERYVLARLATGLPANDERRDYLRANLLEGADGMRIVTPFSLQDSSMQRTFQSSEALILREPHAPEARPGDLVKTLVLDF